MDKLAALVHNYNTDCYKQYTEVSTQLGDQLDRSLQNIERFYYSDFWVKRFYRRLHEEDSYCLPILLDIIQGISTELRENTKFKLFDTDQNSNGISNNNDMIALSTNLDSDSRINNIIMHEFGHRQYHQKGFKLVVELNKRIIEDPEKYIKTGEILEKEDYKYFLDHDEIRLRIIPIVKEMYDNGWSLGEAYDKSENLKIDDIKDIFTREYILKLIDNIL